MKYAALLVVIITVSGQCAAASLGDQDALPERSRLLSDDSGRSVGCLPPPGEPASEAFDKRCKQHLRATKKLRRARPIDRAHWISHQDFPSWLAGTSGTSGYRLTIDGTGAVTMCEITSSSGNEELDRTVCSALKLKARFTPAIDATGTPVPSTYSSSLRWGDAGS